MAAQTIKEDRAKGNAKPKEAKKVEKVQAQVGWVGSTEALEILGISSTGALGKLRANGSINATKVDGVWQHEVASLHKRKADRAQGKQAPSRKVSEPTPPIKSDAPKAKEAPSRNTTPQDARIAQMEKELQEIKSLLTPKPRFARIRRKIAAFRAA